MIKIKIHVLNIFRDDYEKRNSKIDNVVLDNKSVNDCKDYILEND